MTDLTFPVFTDLPNGIVLLINGASSAAEDDFTEAAECFAITRAARIAAAEVLLDDTFFVPSRAPVGAEEWNFSFMGICPLLTFRLKGRPGSRTTFAQFMGYGIGVVDRALMVGTLVKFSTPDFFLIAKRDLGTSSIGALPSSSAPTTFYQQAMPVPTTGQVEVTGDMPGATGERSNTMIYDLGGVRHQTRSKVDLAKREKDLLLSFRAVDVLRWPLWMGSDFVAQPEEYARMINEQARTRAPARDPAFSTCGLLDRIDDLGLTRSCEKLKLFMTGDLFLGSAACLTLSDFESKGMPIASGVGVDLDRNRNLIGALRNLEVALQVFYSAEFAESFSIFIAHLEGAERPMELVSARFMKYSVELTLEKFFRVVRSVKSSNPSCPVLNNPKDCAVYLVESLNLLAVDLSNHSKRMIDEEYFVLRTKRDVSRDKPTVSDKKVEPTVLENKKTQAQSVPAKTGVRTRSVSVADAAGKAPVKMEPLVKKVCMHHLGAHLNAINSTDGKTYKCHRGSKCSFEHENLTGSSDQHVRALISTLPENKRPDLVAKMSKKVVPAPMGE